MTIIINLRLWAGCFGKSTNSFKDAVKGKERAQTKPTTLADLPGPYIVEQKLENLVLTISMFELNGLYSKLYRKCIYM